MPPANPTPGEGSLAYPGWRVVILCFAMALVCWGLGFYGHGFYLAELRRQHGWSTALISSASTACYLLSAVLVIFINDAIRRFGVRTCVLIGALAFALATAALPRISQPWQLFALYLLMALGWTTMSVGAITNILGLWFDAKRGLAISLALNGASLSGVLVVPFLVLVTGAQGFAAAMLISAALVLALILPLLALMPDVARNALNNPAGRGPQIAPAAWTRRAALSSPAFWSVSAPFALAIFSQAGFLVHQLAFLEPALGRTPSGIAVALTTGMAIVGRLLLGACAERIDQRRASALSLVSQAVALTLMLLSVDRHVLFAASALYGFSVGNIITFPALIVQREFDAAQFGMLVGLATGLSQFTYAFGPAVLGLVRDATDGYLAPFGLCIALNLVAAAIVLRRPRSNAGPSLPGS
jgi:MFS family permease